MRLIDADELLDLYSGKRLDDTFVPVPVIRQNIKDMPTICELGVDLEERKEEDD